MKRTVLSLLLALLLAPVLSRAALVNGGTISNPLVDQDNVAKRLVLRAMLVDANGQVISPTSSVGQVLTVYIANPISGTVALTATQAGNLSYTAGMLGNMAGAYLDISRTSLTGITANAAVTRSLTFMAGTSTGIVMPDIIGCAGMTTGYYQIHDGVTPPAFFTANPSQGSSFLCGTSHYYEARKFLGASPHITVYAGGLSFTSGTFSFGLLSRTAQ